MNPFLGTWIANIEKSHRHANHQFQSATLTFEVSGDVVSVTHGEMGRDACACDGSVKGRSARIVNCVEGNVATGSTRSE